MNEISNTPPEVPTRTIIFLDWDDTKIGEMTVPRDVEDVRPLVNAYVRDHFVHPDLRVYPTAAQREAGAL